MDKQNGNLGILDGSIEKISQLDVGIFFIPSETSLDDRKSLLRLQNLIRQLPEGYVYLEIGSHLGGTLVPHLLDPKCRQIYSIDKRPLQQPDERGRDFYYRENSTERMIQTLKETLPWDCLNKLQAMDVDASAIVSSQIPCPADFAFIDAEHTNTAVFKDFLSIFPYCRNSSLIAFHDANLIGDGIQNIEEFLRYHQTEFTTYILPDNVATIFLGEIRKPAENAFSCHSFDKTLYFQNAKQQLWKEITANTLYFRADEEKSDNK